MSIASQAIRHFTDGTNGATQLPPDFNPHTQEITLLYPDGTPVAVPLTEIDLWTHIAVRLISIFASQIGASTVLIILLLALTRPEKRNAPIFCVNLLGLLMVIIRGVLQICYFTGGWYSFFAFWAFYFEDVPRRDYGISIAASVIGLLLHMTILTSLILQVRVVYSSHPKVNRIMTIIATLIGLTSIGFYFTVTVQNSMAIIASQSYISPWVFPTSRGVFAGAISFFSAVFVVKLGMAIRQRRILGLERWGPLQIIFAMGCQTLIVPAIFSILENVNPISFDGMSSLTSFLVAISLPICSMWASASATDKSTISRSSYNPNSGKSSRFIKSNNSRPNGSHMQQSRYGSTSTGSSTLVEKGRANSGNRYEKEEDFDKPTGINVEKTVDVDLLGSERV